ncbi:MAG: serine hydrolase domain-containing protein [Fulvivirga sp.]
MKTTNLIICLLLTIGSQAQIQEMFEREALYQHFNGVVLIQEGDSTIFEGCYNQPNESFTTNTPFDIGSVTKQFTAAAILQLVAQGKLKLDDPINQLLGEYSSKRWKKVTIHHLLTHTSGIPSLFQTEQGLEPLFPKEAPIAKSALIDHFKEGKLLFTPEEEFGYSNSGYILLAAIIEATTGRSYGDYLQQNIFDKYGLNNTSYGPKGEVAKPFYGYRSDRLKPAPVYDNSWFLGAGGIYSTVDDLSRWVDIIQSESFLTESLRGKYFSKHTRAGDVHYGYGWQIDDDGVIAHDGGNAGFMAYLSFHPKTNRKVIMLTNRSFENIYEYGKSAQKIQRLASATWSFMDGEALELLPNPTRGINCEGTFRLDNGSVLSIQRQDSLAILTMDQANPTRVVPNTALAGKTPYESKLIAISSLLEQSKYWKLAKYCDGEMSFVAYSGLLSYGFNMMKKQVGALQSIVPYKVNSDYGLMRMKGSAGSLDIIAYFNAEGEIQGLFEHGFYTTDQPIEMIGYYIDNNTLFVDGFPYGEKDCNITFNGNTVYIEQHGRTVKGEMID